MFGSLADIHNEDVKTVFKTVDVRHTAPKLRVLVAKVEGFENRLKTFTFICSLICFFTINKIPFDFI